MRGMRGKRSRRAGAARLALVVLVGASAATRDAEASDTGPGPAGSLSDPPLPPEPPPPEAYGGYSPDNLIDLSMRRSWNEGRTRAFAAGTLDVGWTYVRPRLSLGYGKPFATWVGVDLNPIVSARGFGGYGGLRLALPRFDLRVGPRYFFAFNREYLNPQGSYNRLDLDSTAGNPARILTFEAEFEASLPGGPGDFIVLGSVSYVTNVPKGQYVFEETLRVIVDPPLVWRARGGYVFRFGTSRQHSAGLVADVLNVPGRDDSTTVRAGPVIRVVLSRRVEVRGTFVPTIISPDHLGLVGGDFTELGFRYRWASE